MFSTASKHVEKLRRQGFQGTSRIGRTSPKNGRKPLRPTVALYLDELLDSKCVNSEDRSVDSHPKQGLPHLALWHHVGVTIGITLDKNGSL